MGVGSLKLNGLFKSDSGHGKLEVKGYHSIDIMFSFICEFVDKVTGYENDENLKKVCSLYFELVTEIFETCWSG